ncbi:xylose operon transcription regulator XylR [Rariglobus hedericola]|uniref:Helix-turn-helix domain-containing protein n=1 Tax=Rariglobus hedericola TaxID=2597822 RepID=A0A556QGW0_9BACT|nr:DNA-binding transcriptional regulator [Rariglobus hedericola]TSJ75869.1 helix-turn-helix domain-containing protein [Rariglobus hedericola]
MAKAPFRVQVVAEETQGYFRDTVLGARRYGFSTGRMVFADRWLDHELAGDLKKLVKRDGVQGIVAAIHTEATERRFASLGIPVVNVSNSIPRPRLPMVSQDDVAVGRLAAEHLRACGCRALGFWGQPGSGYSDERLTGFRAAAREAGLVLSIDGCADRAPETYACMKAWLAKQARPLGLFAVLDSYALSLMRAAKELGWRVPEDVAVLGAGDEDFLVEFESVPLSSVRLPARQIGHEAAALLDRMMTRATRAAKGVRLPGAEIVPRRSTDVIYAEDEAVGRAVRFIREQAEKNPYVGDVAKAAGVSVVALQTRFRAALGRTVLEEIQRVRVGRAQALLANSDLAMSVVAERCGFPNSQRFSVLFRQIAGVSPGVYRRQFSKR